MRLAIEKKAYCSDFENFENSNFAQPYLQKKKKKKYKIHFN
jgi:hypothetical protein